MPRSIDLEKQRPKVGMGVMVFKDGKVLLHKRKNAHGEGEFSFPGGNLEYMESFANCAKRETREEAGIEIENIRFICVAQEKEYAPKHYIMIGVAADRNSGEPKVMEPEKAEFWDWFDVDNLPEPMFAMTRQIIDAFKDNKQYYDA